MDFKILIGSKSVGRSSQQCFCREGRYLMKMSREYFHSNGALKILQYKMLMVLVFVLQLTASSVESSAATRSMWLLPHPLVVCRRT